MVYIPERDWICSRIPIVPKAKWICFRERTYGGQCRKRRLQIMFSTAVAAAAILAGVLFVPSYLQTGDVPAGTSDMLAVDRSSSDPVDKWIHELSDEELEELVDFSDNDIFLN